MTHIHPEAQDYAEHQDELENAAKVAPECSPDGEQDDQIDDDGTLYDAEHAR